MSVPLLVSRLAAHGDRPALLGSRSGGTVTRAALAERVHAEAKRYGDARRLVLLEAGRTEEGVVALLGALAADQVVLLTGPEATAAQRAAYDPDVVVTPRGREEVRAGSAHDLHPDLALLLSTSGSTGSPKLVRLSAENLDANAAQIAEALGIRDDDVAATTLPLHYCFGLSVLTSHLYAGAAVLLTDASVTADGFWADLTRHRVTTFPGVPHTFDLLERSGVERRDLSSLRYLSQAGGRMEPARVRRFAELGRARGFDLRVMYGATEATARMAVTPPGAALGDPATIGRAVPGGRFRLVPTEAAPTRADDGVDGVGELVFEGPNVMLGYAERPADLALGRSTTALRTGDLARIRPDGTVEVVGRCNRVTKVLGLRVDLDRVERRLAARGCVVTAADGGDRLVLGVATAARPVDAGRVLDLVADELDLPGSVISVVPVPEIPRLPSGKPDTRALVALAERRPEVAQAGTGASAERLCAVVAEVLRRPVTPADSFVSLGGDSLSYVEVSLRLERELGSLPAGWATLPLGALADTPSRPARRGSAVETNVLLRAFAIVSIVGTHANLWTLLGGAHLLLAVAGFNTARFHLADVPRRDRVRRLLGGAARIALPSALVIGTVSLWTEELGWRQMLLLNGLTDSTWSEPHWYYWFVEVLVYILLGLAALAAVPAVDRLDRRLPFWLPFGLAVTALVTRFGLLETPGDQIHRAHVVFWLFALGWAALRARGTGHRLLLTALALASVPGFFDEGARNAYVLLGLLALVWVPQVRLPEPVARVAGELAAASLWIYLVHWQVYPHLEYRVPWLATVLSLLAGVLVARLATAVTARRRARTALPDGAAAGPPGMAGRIRSLFPGRDIPTTTTSRPTEGADEAAEALGARPGRPPSGGDDQPAHLAAGPARHR